MLTFFRKIRRALLDSGSTWKYLRYAVGEILLVMVGILLALQVNNWNEGRKSKKQELKLLIQLRDDLLETEREMVGFQRSLRGCDESLTLLLNCKDGRALFDTIKNQRILYAPDVGFFNSVNSSMRFIESEGMSIITSDSIRNRISYLYENLIHNIQKRGEIEYQHTAPVKKFSTKYFDFLTEDTSVDSIGKNRYRFKFSLRDEKGFKEDQEYSNALHRLRSWYQFRSNLLDAASAELRTIISLLEDEVQRSSS